jgi:hypothetical protein
MVLARAGLAIALSAAGCNASSGERVDAPSAALDAGPDATIALDAAGALTIPVTMVTTTSGNQVPSVQISIGGSAPFAAELDTGSVGLRVVTGTIPDSAWTVGTIASSVTYGSGVVADGVIATASMTIGGLPTGAIDVEDITSVSCTGAKPSCPANGVEAAAFRFSGEFPAIMGVGFRATAELASPLSSIGANHQYTLSLPALGGTAGLIAIDPDVTAIARFDHTRIELPVAGAGFDDVTVPFCANALCETGLLDTGQPAMVFATDADADLAKLGVPDGTMVVPAGTVVQVVVGDNQSWSFEVGTTPTAGKDLIRLDGTATVNNLGIAPFHIFDMFYDYAAGVIGIAQKP